ncbi:uncharacterized protein [Parasteatoda tepidariorum]|uniref:uncharacterized protein n=1 Tax=Parasteatoda tepidariorum TaxID=114398 RepID=UPI00077FA9B6|nr:uncharacterized protein LOC107449247 [Parasteatoda tepidariorum]XP_042895530.1 uncharacterized protein LOC107449247 [Parasteatoda tepidariorum]
MTTCSRSRIFEIRNSYRRIIFETPHRINNTQDSNTLKAGTNSPARSASVANKRRIKLKQRARACHPSEEHTSNKSVRNKDFGVLEDCALCLNMEYDWPHLLPCGHIFHNVCVSNWLKRNNTCPVCFRNWENQVHTNQVPNSHSDDDTHRNPMPDSLATSVHMPSTRINDTSELDTCRSADKVCSVLRGRVKKSIHRRRKVRALQSIEQLALKKEILDSVVLNNSVPVCGVSDVLSPDEPQSSDPDIIIDGEFILIDCTDSIAIFEEDVI